MVGYNDDQSGVCTTQTVPANADKSRTLHSTDSDIDLEKTTQESDENMEKIVASLLQSMSLGPEKISTDSTGNEPAEGNEKRVNSSEELKLTNSEVDRLKIEQICIKDDEVSGLKKEELTDEKSFLKKDVEFKPERVGEENEESGDELIPHGPTRVKQNRHHGDDPYRRVMYPGQDFYPASDWSSRVSNYPAAYSQFDNTPQSFQYLNENRSSMCGGSVQVNVTPTWEMPKEMINKEQFTHLNSPVQVQTSYPVCDFADLLNYNNCPPVQNPTSSFPASFWNPDAVQAAPITTFLPNFSQYNTEYASPVSQILPENLIFQNDTVQTLTDPSAFPDNLDLLLDPNFDSLELRALECILDPSFENCPDLPLPNPTQTPDLGPNSPAESVSSGIGSTVTCSPMHPTAASPSSIQNSPPRSNFLDQEVNPYEGYSPRNSLTPGLYSPDSGVPAEDNLEDEWKGIIELIKEDQSRSPIPDQSMLPITDQSMLPIKVMNVNVDDVLANPANDDPFNRMSIKTDTKKTQPSINSPPGIAQCVSINQFTIQAPTPSPPSINKRPRDILPKPNQPLAPSVQPSLPDIQKLYEDQVQTVRKANFEVKTSDDDKRRLIFAYRHVAGLTHEALMDADADGDTILHMAIVKEETFLVRALLDRYKRDNLTEKAVNHHNKQGQTPLCLAVFLNQPEVVRLLIECKADVNVQLQKRLESGLGMRCYNLIHFAASRGQHWIGTLSELLSSKDINLHSMNSEGCTALHCAVEVHGKVISGRENINSKQTILHLALRGADLNKPNGLSNKTPLHCAIEKKSLDLIGYYLEIASYIQSLGVRSVLNVGSTSLVHTMLNTRPSPSTSVLHLAYGLQIDLNEKIRILELLLLRGAELSQKHPDSALKKDLAKVPQLADLVKRSSANGR